MEAVAKLNNNPTSPRKIRLLADLIRGMEVEKALSVLKHHPKHPSVPMEKLLLSAINNWEQKNEGSKAEDANLYVKRITVDEGVTIKRLRPAPQGRGYRVRKRSNHLMIVVDSKVSQGVVAEPAAEEKKEEVIQPAVETPKVETKAKTSRAKKPVATEEKKEE